MAQLTSCNNLQDVVENVSAQAYQL